MLKPGTKIPSNWTSLGGSIKAFIKATNKATKAALKSSTGRINRYFQASIQPESRISRTWNSAKAHIESLANSMRSRVVGLKLSQKFPSRLSRKPSEGARPAGVVLTEGTTATVQESTVSLQPEEFLTNIGDRLKKAQAGLQQRQQPNELRSHAQLVFAQGESILVEAIRSAEAASDAYQSGFAADTDASAEKSAGALARAEFLRSYLVKNQTAYANALQRAHVIGEKSATELVAALDSLNEAGLDEPGEMKASVKASTIADSVKTSAVRELREVQSIWNGLASLGIGPLTPEPDVRHRPTIKADSPVVSSAGESNLAASTDSAESDGFSASEALRKELAGLTTITDEELAELQDASAVAKQQAGLNPIPDTFGQPYLPGKQTARSHSRSHDGRLSGRVYLMLDASLSKEGLESVWDAVEEAADTGVIVDTRLLSVKEGVQVTLDLEQTVLDVDAFLRRLPGAELSLITEDKLKVAWPVSA